MTKTQKNRLERNVGRILIDSLGYRSAWPTAVFILMWWQCSDELGRPPESVDEFAQRMVLERATAFRHQSHFRRAFPDFSTPTDLRSALPLSARTVAADVTESESVAVQLFGVALP